MYGIRTLLPTRFLVLLAHLCIALTLLWNNHTITLRCSPQERVQSPSRSTQNQLIAGFSMTIALIIIELLTFITGLTMFSSTACLVSAICHGTATLLLTYFTLDTWACNTFWWIFFLGSALPTAVDLNAALTADTEQPSVRDESAGWSFLLILAAVVTTFGSSLPVGYNIGVVNSPADIIKGFCNESFISRYNVTLSPSAMDILWSSIVSVFIVGGVTGSLLGALLADHFGRKGAMVIVNILSILGSVMFLYCQEANSVEMLIIGRILVGLSAGLTTCVVPMYLAELAPARLTGALGVICPMGVNFGVLAGQVLGLKVLLGDVNDWPYLLACYGLLVVVFFPLLLFLPESPKYLYVIKEETERATRELCRVRGLPRTLLSQELSVLQQEVAAVSAKRGDGGVGGVLHVWRQKELLMPLLLTCTMQAGQQTSGINAVFYYSTSIFKAAGLSPENAVLATIGAGFINCVTAVLVIFLLSRCGRRRLLLGSTASAAVTLFCLAVVTKLSEHIQWMAYLCIAAVLLYVLIYGFGLGPIPYFIASELFEVGARPAGMAWGSLSNWGGNFLVGMTFPTVRTAIGPYSFLIFGIFTTALFVFQKMYLPETKGRTPAEVALLCKDGFKSRPYTTEISTSSKN